MHADPAHQENQERRVNIDHIEIDDEELRWF